MNCRRLALLTLLLLAGCTSTRGLPSGQDPRIAYFQRESQKIDGRESRCISEASGSSEHEIASIMASVGASKDDRKQQVGRDRDKSMNACRTNASHEREALSERERDDYRNGVQEQRAHESLMAVLTSGLR
jgi:hypothetical protein